MSIAGQILVSIMITTFIFAVYLDAEIIKDRWKKALRK